MQISLPTSITAQRTKINECLDKIKGIMQGFIGNENIYDRDDGGKIKYPAKGILDACDHTRLVQGHKIIAQNSDLAEDISFSDLTDKIYDLVEQNVRVKMIYANVSFVLNKDSVANVSTTTEIEYESKNNGLGKALDIAGKGISLAVGGSGAYLANEIGGAIAGGGNLIGKGIKKVAGWFGADTTEEVVKSYTQRSVFSRKITINLPSNVVPLTVYDYTNRFPAIMSNTTTMNLNDGNKEYFVELGIIKKTDYTSTDSEPPEFTLSRNLSYNEEKHAIEFEIKASGGLRADKFWNCDLFFGILCEERL